MDEHRTHPALPEWTAEDLADGHAGHAADDLPTEVIFADDGGTILLCRDEAHDLASGRHDTTFAVRVEALLRATRSSGGLEPAQGDSHDGSAR
jgi:hypothetical protein